MAQSLVRTPPQAAQALQANGRPLPGAHDQITSILRARLGHNHASLLATPKIEADGGIQWSTALAGPVSRAADLPDEDRRALEQRVERVLNDIRGLSAQMRGEGPAAQIVAQIVEAALRTPPGDWLYSVGGKPVLAMWGHAAAGSAAPSVVAPSVVSPATAASGPARVAGTPAQPTAAPSAAGAAGAAPLPAVDPGVPASASVGGGDGAPAAPVARPAEPRKRGLLLALAALLLLAPLLWWMAHPGESAADAALAEQIAEAEARNRQLEEEIARKGALKPTVQCVADPMDLLEQRVAAAGENCATLAGLLESEPLLKGADPKAAALRKQVEGTIEQRCKQAPPAAEPAQEPPRAVAEKKQCPGERPVEEVLQFVMVFDASLSMAYSLDASEAEIAQARAVEDQFEEAQKWASIMGLRLPPSPMDRVTREPQRMTAARRAAIAVAGRIPADMSTGLVMVDYCEPGARSIGMFAPSRRAEFLQRVRNVRVVTPGEPGKKVGTPLADGLAKAGRLIDGVNRDAVMLVISDGEESCQGDPCATAAALARAKPRLKINVLDISGTGAGNCVAAATKGKVYTANNASEVATMMQRATQDAMAPPGC